MKVYIPVEGGNHAIKEGILPKIVAAFTETCKPEACFFTTTNAERSMIAVFDLKSSSDIPSIAEPFFQNLKARLEFSPCMSFDDLKAGMSKLNHY